MDVDTIYNDFITKLLPQIQQGLTITKEYFTDLFGRYVKYLIITDGIWTIVGLLIVVLTIISVSIMIYYAQKEGDTGEVSIFIGMIGFIILMFGFFTFFYNGEKLIKDFYIPEVRIMEILQNRTN